MKKIIAFIIASAFVFPAAAQYVEQGLNFSQTFPSMTARSLSMGGAFTSLGGDLSAAYLNPAGLGMYRKSEFSFSPAIGYIKSSSVYLNEKGEDFRYKFNFGSAGYVSTYNTRKEKGLVGASFSLAYNRLNDFHNNIYIQGINPTNSLADLFLDQSNGIHPDDLMNNGLYGERLAFDAYVIDTVPGSPTSYSTPVFLPVSQRRSIETEGGTGEWSIGFGLNFSHVFYFGLGLGINQINYSKTLVHTESDDANLNVFNNFRYTEKLDLSGAGASLKIGFIARPIPILRLSGALHTPIYYNISEDYEYHMSSYFDDGFSPTVEPIYGEFDYKLVTPLKVLGGLSVQIGKAGLIATDVEYVDYSNIRYRNENVADDITALNSYIQEDYKSVLNLKAGGELRFGQLSLRAGGGYYPSPYAGDKMFDRPAYKEFTGGFGFREKSFYIDMGFSALLRSQDYVLYYDNVADLKTNRYRLITTFGFRF
jgi:hypothetical protein